jgi:hypothetical protein
MISGGQAAGVFTDIGRYGIERYFYLLVNKPGVPDQEQSQSIYLDLSQYNVAILLLQICLQQFTLCCS